MPGVAGSSPASSTSRRAAFSAAFPSTDGRFRDMSGAARHRLESAPACPEVSRCAGRSGKVRAKTGEGRQRRRPARGSRRRQPGASGAATWSRRSGLTSDGMHPAPDFSRAWHSRNRWVTSRPPSNARAGPGKGPGKGLPLGPAPKSRPVTYVRRQTPVCAGSVVGL
jgi:hypothetical protein